MTKQFLAPILSDAINYELKIIRQILYLYSIFHFCLSICLTFCLSVSPLACLSNVCLPVCLLPVVDSQSVCLPAFLSLCLPACLPVACRWVVFVCRSFCLPVCLSVCLFEYVKYTVFSYDY